MHLKALYATLLAKELQADLLLPNLQQVDVLLILYGLLKCMFSDIRAVNVESDEEIDPMRHFLQHLSIDPRPLHR